jgi:DNA-binding NarL/FixJ family response regulator
MAKAANENPDVLLADDQPVTRLGFAALLRQMDERFVVHEADCPGAALDIARSVAPRMALMDLFLAGSLGFDLIKRLRLAAPDMAILVVSAHDERLYAERAIKAGARGYVMKQAAPKAMKQAVEAVQRGKVWLSEALRDDLVNRLASVGLSDDPTELSSLSDREITVFRLIGQGLKKGDIARELRLSPHTVETYRSNIKKKLGLASGAELYRQAFLRSQAG